MNVFDLAAKLTLDDSEYTKGLKSAAGGIDDFGSKVKNALGSAAKTAAAAAGVAVSIGAITKAFVDSGKAAVEAYANYEQLAGGAQLMFGDAYNTVARNASEAYATVQMSQNEYLQQVNGFATGLKTALGNNEQAAADLAHKIVTAEADVVAATGNTQEAVQNAFNGVMRGNFVMLDNLQLGIKPTKEGFQEVIDKVNEWNETNGKATKYQMGNYADMEAALVDYVAMVGLSGYASKEAAQTIQGSHATMKASWQNLLVAMASGEGDIEAKSKQMIDSVKNYVKNVTPAIKNFIKSIPVVFKQVGTTLSKDISAKFEEIKKKLAKINWTEVGTKLINDVTKKVGDIVKNVREWFTKAKDEIGKVDWKQAGTNLVKAIGTAFTNIGDTFKRWFEAGKNGIEQIDWAGTGRAILGFIGTAWNALNSWASGIWETAKAGIESVNWAEVGTAVEKNVAGAWANLKDWAAYLWESAKAGIIAIDWAEVGRNVLEKVKEGLSALVSTMTTLFTTAKDALFGGTIDWKQAGTSIYELIKSGLEAIGQAFLNIFTEAKDGLTDGTINWTDLGKSILDLIIAGFESLGELLKGLFSAAWKDILSIDWGGLGLDILNFILDGMGDIGAFFRDKFNVPRRVIEEDVDWEGAGQKVEKHFIDGLDALPRDTERVANEGAKRVQGGAGRYTDAGATAGKNFASAFDAAAAEALIAISKIQQAINNIKGKKITITADIKAGANAKVGSNGKITPMARAMDRGYIYRHATIFGYDHDNDTYQMAGDAGPEAVVGVHSLSNMIQESVNKAVGKTQSAMIGVLNKILDVMPKGDVVLDTGALVGGIAGEMNGELERLTAWSGGGRAL